VACFTPGLVLLLHNNVWVGQADRVRYSNKSTVRLPIRNSKHKSRTQGVAAPTLWLLTVCYCQEFVRVKSPVCKLSCDSGRESPFPALTPTVVCYFLCVCGDLGVKRNVLPPKLPKAAQPVTRYGVPVPKPNNVDGSMFHTVVSELKCLSVLLSKSRFQFRVHHHWRQD